MRDSVDHRARVIAQKVSKKFANEEFDMDRLLDNYSIEGGNHVKAVFYAPGREKTIHRSFMGYFRSTDNDWYYLVSKRGWLPENKYNLDRFRDHKPLLTRSLRVKKWHENEGGVEVAKRWLKKEADKVEVRFVEENIAN